MQGKDAVIDRSERVAWLLAGLWALGIFALVPLARTVQRIVREGVGNEAFGYAALACIAIGAALALRRALRGGSDGGGAMSAPTSGSSASLLWLVGVAAVFIWYTTRLWHNAEEAMHFVQYGVLSILLFRAVSRRVHDAWAFVIPVLLAALVGQIDECFQWLIPRRYYGLRDIWIDFVAASLTQIGLGMGLRPAHVARRFGIAGARSALLLASLNLAILTLCSLNTPERVERYAARFTPLAFLAGNPSAMFEFGTLYVEENFGFKSRLGPRALAAADRERGREVGERIRASTDYEQFLDEHPPGRAPFAHEVRVHLFRRDRMLERAAVATHPERFQSYTTQALREHWILEAYFPPHARVRRRAFASSASRRDGEGAGGRGGVLERGLVSI